MIWGTLCCFGRAQQGLMGDREDITFLHFERTSLDLGISHTLIDKLTGLVDEFQSDDLHHHIDRVQLTTSSFSTLSSLRGHGFERGPLARPGGDHGVSATAGELVEAADCRTGRPARWGRGSECGERVVQQLF